MIDIILTNLKSILVFSVFLGILVIVHEWGHFYTAKKLGVKVEKFAFGFGPKLWSMVHKGTEYMWCLFPLGGFVKMAGDERDQVTGDPQEFYSQPVGHRALIVFNGPLVNFILAYVCLILVFMLGRPDMPARVNDLVKDYPAYMADIKIGDDILAVNGEDVFGWDELKKAISRSKAEAIDLTIKRDESIFETRVIPKEEEGISIFGKVEKKRTIGITPFSNVIGEVSASSPAGKSGLIEGDRIISVDGASIEGWALLQTSISQSTNTFIALEVLRDNKILNFNVEPKIVLTKDDDGLEVEIRQIGISPYQELASYEFGFLTSVVKGTSLFWEYSVMTLKALYSMVTGSMSAKDNVGGPVLIFTIVKKAAEMGMAHFLLILGVISLNLAIFNLLPIIPLDGGHLFLMGIEKLRGRPLPEKIDETISKAGLTLILLLAVFIFYVDFERIGLFVKVGQFFSNLF